MDRAQSGSALPEGIVEPQFSWHLLHPKYWLVWLGFGIWWCLALLPCHLHYVLAWLLGRVFYALNVSRVKVARKNIAACFPELDATKQKRLLLSNLTNTCLAFFETGMLWWWPRWRLDRHIRLIGQEHLQALDGRGAILLGLHCTQLEVAGGAILSRFPCDPVYRPHDNPIYEWVQYRGRASNGRNRKDGTYRSVIRSRRDLRSVVKAVKQGRIIWMASDQDFGPANAQFVDFFGIPTATVSTPVSLARLTKAPTLLLMPNRVGIGRYEVVVSPPLENFPSGDERVDLQRINLWIQDWVKQYPDNYLWVHRRFKTRPEGDPAFY